MAVGELAQSSCVECGATFEYILKRQIGFFKDDPDRLANAIVYLEGGGWPS